VQCDHHGDASDLAPETFAHEGSGRSLAGSAIRVLVADDHPSVRESLQRLLSRAQGLTVVAVAADGAQAVALARLHRPDVVIMDLRMPVLCGAAATRRIVADDLAGHVLILTATARPRDLREALEAGAIGYLLKDADPDELVRAIRQVSG
jgi:DNA-binding NarL/FixJ family response regulator